MKKILILLLAVLAGNVYSQSIVVDGHITQMEAGALANPVNLSIDRTHLGVHPDVITAKTNEGYFSFVLHEPKEFIGSLSYGNESYPLFLAPNDTLHVAFSADLLNLTLRLSGNAAAENLFLKKFIKTFADNFNDSLMNTKMLITNVDAFEIDIFNSRKQQMEFFKKDSSYLSFSPAFKNYFTNLVNYRYWNLLFAFPIVRANNSTTTIQVDELPETMLEGFEKVKIVNEDALTCDSYRSFLRYYIIYFTSKQNGFHKFSDFNLSMERKNFFAQSALSGAPYQYWLSSFLLDDFQKVQPSIVRHLYSSLTQSDKQGIYASIVKEKCGAYMEKKDEVKKTAVADAASSKSSSGEDAFRILNDKGKQVRFSDFKGKVVYVDFWASWCGPCRQEMPHSKELHHKLTEKQLKNIVFLYVSIDKDSSAWRKAVQEIGMEGVTGWSAADWPDGAGSFFRVNSIPRYMLIDKKGKIVDENARRPSDPLVMGDILELLQ